MRIGVFSRHPSALLINTSRRFFAQIDTSFVGSYVPDLTPTTVTDTEDLPTACNNILIAHKHLLSLDPSKYFSNFPLRYRNMGGTVETEYEDHYMPIRETYFTMTELFREWQDKFEDAEVVSTQLSLSLQTLMALDAAEFVTRHLHRPEWLPENRRTCPKLQRFAKAIVTSYFEGNPSASTTPLTAQELVNLLNMAKKFKVNVTREMDGDVIRFIDSQMADPGLARSALHALRHQNIIPKCGTLIDKAMLDCENYDMEDLHFMLEILALFPPGQRRQQWVARVLRRAKVVLYRQTGTVVSYKNNSEDMSENITAVQYWNTYKDDRPGSKEPHIGYSRILQQQGNYSLQEIAPADAMKIVKALSALDVNNEHVFAADLLARMTRTKGSGVEIKDSTLHVADTLYALHDLQLREKLKPKQFEDVVVNLDHAFGVTVNACDGPTVCRTLHAFGTLPYKPYCLNRMYATIARHASVLRFDDYLLAIEGMAMLGAPDDALLTLFARMLQQLPQNTNTNLLQDEAVFCKVCACLCVLRHMPALLAFQDVSLSFLNAANTNGYNTVSSFLRVHALVLAGRTTDENKKSINIEPFCASLLTFEKVELEDVIPTLVTIAEYNNNVSVVKHLVTLLAKQKNEETCVYPLHTVVRLLNFTREVDLDGATVLVNSVSNSLLVLSENNASSTAMKESDVAHLLEACMAATLVVRDSFSEKTKQCIATIVHSCIAQQDANACRGGGFEEMGLLRKKQEQFAMFAAKSLVAIGAGQYL
eukprot:PhF_6_TR27792/c0_g1_i1/m.40485